MDKNTPLVSIVIPYFNHQNYLMEALSSIQQQHYSTVEVIIVDDGSEEIIDEASFSNYSFPIKLIHQENAGPCIAKNKGAKVANGEILLFLDSDNKIRKEYIHKAVEIFSKKPNISVVYSDFYFFGEKTGTHRSNVLNSNTLILYNSIDNCVLIRKKAFIEVGGFDEFLSKKGLEDWELWIHLFSKEYHFHYIQEVLFDYRVTGKSRTFEVADKNIGDIKNYIYKKHADLICSEYEKLFYSNKALLESPDYKIGNMILLPYRLIKNIFKKHD